MALERKPQNLRGYGLAQDPKVELDTTFIDDQNRRAYQQKGIEAQQEAQQKNFAQRDKEGVIKLLSNQEQVKTNWQPELRDKLVDNQLSIIDTAFDIPQTELISRLMQSGNQVAQYNNIGETIASNALLLAKEGFASGMNFDAIISGESSDMFSGKSITEGLALGYAAANEVATIPTEQEIQDAANNVQDFAIKNTKGKMEYFTTLPNGDVLGRIVHPIDLNLNAAGALGLTQNHQKGIELMRQKGVDVFGYINSYFQQDKAYESGVQRSIPRADKEPKGFRATGNGYTDDIYRYTIGKEKDVPMGDNATGDVNTITLSRESRDTPVKAVDFYEEGGDLITGRIRQMKQYPNGERTIVIQRKDNFTEEIPYEGNEEIILGEYTLDSSKLDDMFNSKDSGKEQVVEEGDFSEFEVKG